MNARGKESILFAVNYIRSNAYGLLVITALMASSKSEVGAAQPSGRPPYAPDEIVSDLKSNDPKANGRALDYLLTLFAVDIDEKLKDRKRDVTRALVPYLDTDERELALILFGRIGPDAKEAVPVILRFVKLDTPGDDRLADVARFTLQRIGPNAVEAVPVLIQSFRRFFFGEFDNPSYRRGLPITLNKIAPTDPRVRTFLRKALQDDDGGVRVNAAWQLWEQGERTPELKAIWLKAQEDKDPAVRECVGAVTAYLARQAPELLPLALARVNDNTDWVRMSTIEVLVDGKFAQAEVLDAYVKRLTDENWYTRSIAFRGIKELGGKAAGAGSELKKLLKHDEAIVRVDCARLLYAINNGTAGVAVKVLVEALRDGSDFVRRAAVEGVGELGPAASAAMPALEKMLLNKNESKEVKQSVAKAIEQIKRKQVK